jgi:hypothetical protein
LSYFQVHQNHFFISVRSLRLAVCSHDYGGDDWSLITSIVNGQWKESKTKEATAPAAAGSACDILSAGAALVFFWRCCRRPRAAVEAENSAAPDDPSEGDKLTLVISIVTALAVTSARSLFAICLQELSA